MTLGATENAFKRPASRIMRKGVWFGFAYRVAAPTEWLYKTGSGAKHGIIIKKTLQKPFQQVSYVDISPVNYHFNVNSMSSEMVPFQLPMVFTIGPVDPMSDATDPSSRTTTSAPAVNLKLNPASGPSAAANADGSRTPSSVDAFRTYCQRLSTLSRDEIRQIVEGVIQGEVRVLSASMTIREMFQGREEFRQMITLHVQKDLEPMGLKIYNANIAEMHDLDSQNKYFENLKMKALEGANTEARLQVAEARNRGDVGEAERKADTSMRKATIQAGLTEKNNMRMQAIIESDASLKVKQAEADRRQREAAVATDVAVRQRQVELETELANKQAAQRTEVLRSTMLAEAGVKAEAQVKQADGDARARVKAAEAGAAAVRLTADAALYQQLKEAEGKRRLAEAQAAGVAAILSAAGGNTELAKFYIGVERGLFTSLAAETGAAIRGLQPKINVWNTGPAGEGGADSMSAIRNLFTGMPPILDALAQQTNVQLPSFMPQVKTNGSTSLQNPGAAAGQRAAIARN